MDSTEQKNIDLLKYTAGSLFQIIGDLEPITVKVKNAKFSNCYTALEGGVFSMKTLTSKITVSLEGNEFKVAVPSTAKIASIW